MHLGASHGFFGWAVQGRLGKFCCVEPGPGSARTDKVRFGRIGEAGRVTDRTVEEWQATLALVWSVGVVQGAVWIGRRG